MVRRIGRSARALKAGGAPIGLSRNNSLLQAEFKGAKELAEALRALGQDRLIKATLKRALLKAGQPMVETAQRLAPRGKRKGGDDAGKPHMADKIAVSTTLSKRQRRQQGFGAHRGRTDNTAVVFIGAGPRGPAVLAEFGTGPRRRKNGQKTGSTPAQPFMRPAWEQHHRQILEDFGRELGIQIEKSAARLGRRQKKKAGLA